MNHQGIDHDHRCFGLDQHGERTDYPRVGWPTLCRATALISDQLQLKCSGDHQCLQIMFPCCVQGCMIYQTEIQLSMKNNDQIVFLSMFANSLACRVDYLTT